MIRVNYLLVCMAFLMLSCGKTDSTNTVNEDSDEQIHVRNDEEHEPYTEEYEQLANNPEEPSTQGITVNEGVLQFEDMDAFGAVMNTLVNQPDSKLDAWEDALGFTSIRNYNESFLADEEASELIDEDEFDDSRIQDPAFETVLSISNEIIIGELGYTFDYSDMEDRILTIWNADDPNEIIEIKNLDLKKTGSANNNGTCGIYKNVGAGKRISEVKKNYSSKKRIKAKKGTSSWFIFTSIFASVKYSEKNWLGIWKGEKTDLAIQLDQWHFLTYELDLIPGVSMNCITNVEKNEHTKKLKHTFAHETNKGKFGVCEFGRVHHWKKSEGYDNDAHTETWQ